MTSYWNNLSANNIFKNLIQHIKTNHIDIHHHFIKEHVEDKVMNHEYIATEQQRADILTKVSDFVQFENLRGSLGICLYENL